jgi:hypothetical protein
LIAEICKENDMNHAFKFLLLTAMLLTMVATAYCDTTNTPDDYVNSGIAKYGKGDVDGSIVSERSKPASRERMKTSHFEGRIALGATDVAQRRDESTQRELATFDNDLGGAWLVPPADCA